MNLVNKHSSNPPKSNDFQDGQDAEGSWFEKQQDGRLVKITQVAGGSGVYLIVEDAETGKVLRDDRPWQMTV